MYCFKLIRFNIPLAIFIGNNAFKISMENDDFNPKLKHI
jgi:hypothetical protein